MTRLFLILTVFILCQSATAQAEELVISKSVAERESINATSCNRNSTLGFNFGGVSRIGISGSRCNGLSAGASCLVNISIGFGQKNNNPKSYDLGRTSNSSFNFLTQFRGQPVDRRGKNRGISFQLGFICDDGNSYSSNRRFINPGRFNGRKQNQESWRRNFSEMLTRRAGDYFQSDNGSGDSQADWKPSPGATWQWQLTEAIDYSVNAEVFDIDPFSEDTQPDAVSTLKGMNKKVICYFSAGTFEDWRKDARLFPEFIKGNAVQKDDDGGETWEGERWLDIRQIDLLRPIMKARMHRMKQLGCDGVEPDNVDAYQPDNNPGFPITENDQINYNKMLAQEAHSLGLSIGLKNALDLVEQLVGEFDFAVNEQCFEYSECDKLTPFIQKNKAVFGVEYELNTGQFCSQANALRFSWLRKNYDLDVWRESCL